MAAAAGRFKGREGGHKGPNPRNLPISSSKLLQRVITRRFKRSRIDNSPTDETFTMYSYNRRPCIEMLHARTVVCLVAPNAHR